MKENTAGKILDIAQDLVRQRGYSAFSYADISERVGIRKASIHYHFPSKEELTRELVRRYRDTFQRKLKQIEQATSDPQKQLSQFVRLYRDGLNEAQICLCGMLSADLTVLPKPVQDEVSAFFSDNRAWLAKVLQNGSEVGCLQVRSSVTCAAMLVLATLHGAQLLARVSDDREATFDQIAELLLATLM
jgi:TetR/AcrR family transcriptional repressor of nem operon